MKEKEENIKKKAQQAEDWWYRFDETNPDWINFQSIFFFLLFVVIDERVCCNFRCRCCNEIESTKSIKRLIRWKRDEKVGKEKMKEKKRKEKKHHQTTIYLIEQESFTKKKERFSSSFYLLIYFIVYHTFYSFIFLYQNWGSSTNIIRFSVVGCHFCFYCSFTIKSQFDATNALFLFFQA